MYPGPGSYESYGDNEPDSLSYFEGELAQTIEDSILESIDDSGGDHMDEDEDECSD